MFLPKYFSADIEKLSSDNTDILKCWPLLFYCPTVTGICPYFTQSIDKISRQVLI